MTKHRKAALLAAMVGIAFVGLQAGVGTQTGLAGLFILGMAGGLLIGGEMTTS